LRKATSGRIWEGKGVLFDALAAVYESGAAGCGSEADARELVQLFARDAAKPNKEHRALVLVALATLLKAVPPSFDVIDIAPLLDMLEKAVAVQKKCAVAAPSADAKTAEAKAQEQKEIKAVAQRNQKIAEAVLKCLLNGLRSRTITGSEAVSFMTCMIAVCRSMVCSPASQQLLGFKVLDRLLELGGSETALPGSASTDIWDCFATCLQSRFELVRIAALGYIHHIMVSSIPQMLASFIKPHSISELRTIITDSFGPSSSTSSSITTSETVMDVLAALDKLQ